MSNFANVFDFRRQAAASLDEAAWAYYEAGAGAEETLAANEAVFQQIRLQPRCLVDVSNRNMEVSVLGTRVSLPVLIAPTAFHGLAHDEAELATAQAAGRANTLFTVSALANKSLEDIAAAAPGPLWFQTYVLRDRGATRDLVQRAQAAGYRALVLTGDSPVVGRRERSRRAQFKLPPGLRITNLNPYADRIPNRPPGASGAGLGYIARELDPSLDWSVVEWLRQICDLPIVIKGIQRADDARRAIEYGAQAVWVSNHGGRQLDCVPPTLEVLPPVVTACAGRAEVYLDGGIRRGTDVLKALALGARAVFVGRPILWGLAAAGAQGVETVLHILRDELDNAMALVGCPTLADVNEEIIFRPQPWP